MDGKLFEIRGVELRSLPTDQEWRRRAEERMAELEVSQKELVSHVGAPEGKHPQSGVSYALTGGREQRRSQYVMRISCALGIDLPLVARAELAVEAIAQKSPHKVEGFIQMNEEEFAPEELQWVRKKKS